MRKYLTAVVMMAVAVGVVSLVRAAEPKEIKEVMKEAHVGGKDSLRAKVIGGKAEAEDKEKLLALYKDLAANKPPRGDEKAWEKRTKAIVSAAEGVVNGDKAALQKLNQATNCAACHGVHKPKS